MGKISLKKRDNFITKLVKILLHKRYNVDYENHEQQKKYDVWLGKNLDQKIKIIAPHCFSSKYNSKQRRKKTLSSRGNLRNLRRKFHYIMEVDVYDKKHFVIW